MMTNVRAGTSIKVATGQQDEGELQVGEVAGVLRLVHRGTGLNGTRSE